MGTISFVFVLLLHSGLCVFSSFSYLALLPRTPGIIVLRTVKVKSLSSSQSFEEDIQTCVLRYVNNSF